MGGSAVSDNRFLYNGKESQATGGLNYLDYGARMYDARKGRWHGPDPLGEKRFSNSLYSYCSNNPINRLDIDGKIDWPLNGIVAVNKRDYGNGAWGLTNTVVRTSTYNETRNIGTSPHIGIDYRASTGTPVYSLGDGVVSDVGTMKNGIKYISIEYGNGDVVRFLHLDNFSEGMDKGANVYEGQIVGESGNSGQYKNAEGNMQDYQPHLHIDATDKNGNHIDPEKNKYGTISNEKFFNEMNGDYKKLLDEKLESIRKINEAGRQ